MNCLNCGATNNVGSKFCIKCGKSLEDTQTLSEQSINNTSVHNETESQVNTATPQSVNTNGISTAKVTFIEYFFIILAVILKPFTTFKEELNKFNSFKNSAVMSLIVSGSATLINLIKTMLNSVMVKSYDWSSGGFKTALKLENLKEIKYLEVIGKNFLIYLCVIVAIAGIYYIASLILKKQVNFSRLLSVSAIAVVPILICSLVLSPLLSLVWAKLAVPITLIGSIYTLILAYEGMNSEILLEGNAKYYFNLVCLSILGISAYYLFLKLFISSISGGLENILNLFG